MNTYRTIFKDTLNASRSGDAGQRMCAEGRPAHHSEEGRGLRELRAAGVACGAGSRGGELEGSADTVSAGGKNMQGLPADWE